MVIDSLLFLGRALATLPPVYIFHNNHLQVSIIRELSYYHIVAISIDKSYYILLKVKEVMKMAFGVDCERHERREERFEGIAIVAVIILLLIAMGIVF